MKRNRFDINKKIVKKMIKLKHSRPKVSKKNERNKLRTSGTPKPISHSLADRNSIRTLGKSKLVKLDSISEYIPYEVKNYGVYEKQSLIDYDTIIYISSYNRYEKLINILNQLYSQKSDYSFKVIVMDDGSTDKRYLNLENEFPSAIYLKNEENGGREFYLETINTVFQEIKKYNTLSVIQIDDDFILCDGFIDKLMIKFFQLKEKNNSYMGIRYHQFGYVKNTAQEEDFFDTTKKYQNFDGGSLYDIQFLRLFNYELIRKEEGNLWHMWGALNSLVKKLGVLVYTMRESLVFHDGNDESKMNPEARKIKKLYTCNFIDNEK